MSDPKTLHVVWEDEKPVMFGTEPFTSVYGNSVPMVEKAHADRLADLLRAIFQPNYSTIAPGMAAKARAILSDHEKARDA